MIYVYESDNQVRDYLAQYDIDETALINEFIDYMLDRYEEYPNVYNKYNEESRYSSHVYNSVKWFIDNSSIVYNTLEDHNPDEDIDEYDIVSASMKSPEGFRYFSTLDDELRDM